jgi:hypothetical protein
MSKDLSISIRDWMEHWLNGTLNPTNSEKEVKLGGTGPPGRATVRHLPALLFHSSFWWSARYTEYQDDLVRLAGYILVVLVPIIFSTWGPSSICFVLCL